MNILTKATQAAAPTAGEDLTNKTYVDAQVATKAASSHTHTIAQVTSLQTTLDGKALTSHTHTTAQVTGLDSALSGKAASSHTHTIANVTNLQTTLDAKAGTAVATQSTNGLMSSTDKTKLDGIESGGGSSGAPLPTVTAGVGQWGNLRNLCVRKQINSLQFMACLPAGGTWAFIITSTTGDITFLVADPGVVAGGTELLAVGSSGTFPFTGLAWRIA